MKKAQKTKTSGRTEWISYRNAFLLVVLCFAVYANGLGGDFVWDDQIQVSRNPNIRTLDNIPRAFTTTLWSFMYSQDPSANNRGLDLYYRPLQTVIYMLVYQLAGLSPFAYHLTNLILHSIATVFVYFLCRQLGLDSMISLMAGALFAVHPVHTEAVTWIAGVGDVACSIFYFAALLTFLRHLTDRNPRWLWISAMCFLGALFSKEVGITVPIVCFFILTAQKERLQDFKSAAVMLGPYIGAGCVYVAFRLNAVGLHPPSGNQISASLTDWASLVVWMLGAYTRYLIVPYPLYIYHLTPIHLGDRTLSTLGYAVIVGGMISLMILWRRRSSGAFLWLLVFFTTLLPVLYFKGINGYVFFAERYLYIPSMAIVIVGAFLLVKLKRTHAVFITGSIVCIFSVLTVQRNRDWHNEERLFERTVKVQPQTATMWASLGEVHLRRGNFVQAKKDFETALQHLADPGFVLQNQGEDYRIYHGLGLVAALQSRPDDAVKFLEKALEIDPQGDAAYTTLGGVLVNQGRDPGRGTALLEKAIRLNPVNDLARDYMGVALLNQGRVEEAVQYFRQALEINPDLASAQQHLEIALRAKK
jgi:protein O-mannosyl-transferase